MTVCNFLNPDIKINYIVNKFEDNYPEFCSKGNTGSEVLQDTYLISCLAVTQLNPCRLKFLCRLIKHTLAYTSILSCSFTYAATHMYIHT